MLLILHAFTCLCWTGTQAPSARMHAPLSGRHTGTFGTHARASVGQAHRHLRHACTRLCRAGTQAPLARMHAPLSGRHLRHAYTRLCRAGTQAPSARMHSLVG